MCQLNCEIYVSLLRTFTLDLYLHDQDNLRRFQTTFASNIANSSFFNIQETKSYLYFVLIFSKTYILPQNREKKESLQASKCPWTSLFCNTNYGTWCYLIFAPCFSSIKIFREGILFTYIISCIFPCLFTFPGPSSSSLPVFVLRFPTPGISRQKSLILGTGTRKI